MLYERSVWGSWVKGTNTPGIIPRPAAPRKKSPIGQGRTKSPNTKVISVYNTDVYNMLGLALG